MNAEAGAGTQTDEADPFALLRRATRARVALGRAGDALPTREVLAFAAAHAAARDAVHTALDVDGLTQALGARGERLGVVAVASQAEDRATYLTRPDLGRRLSQGSASALADHVGSSGDEDAIDLVLVLADGLSARAVQEHAPAVVEALLDRLGDGDGSAGTGTDGDADAEGDTDGGWRLGPLVLATQARVALGDDVGDALGARLVVVLIGERPGLTSPDSLGAYLTWEPRRGRRDSERNCVSNVRPPDGQTYAQAADTLVRLLTESRRRELSGVDLKDSGGLEAGAGQTPLDAPD